MRKESVVVLAAALVAGLIGGALSERWAAGTAGAKEPSRPAKVVQAEAFELVDKGGKVRAKLSMKENGWVGLTLSDVKGRPRALLSVTPDGNPTLLLNDQDGKGHALFGLGEAGQYSLFLMNKKGEITWSAP